MDSLCLTPGISPAIGGAIEVRSSAVAKLTTTQFSRFSFRHPLRSFWPGTVRRGGGVGVGGAVADAGGGVVVEENEVAAAAMAENWILKILHVSSLWSGGEQRKERGCCGGDREEAESFGRREGSDNAGNFTGDGCRVDEDEKEVEFDRDSFSRLLRRVSLTEAKLYAQMSYLGNIAYCISKIQTENLLRCYNLRFVTSSIDKRELTAKAELAEEPKKDTKQQSMETENQIRPSDAYRIGASAASYLHSRTKSLIPFASPKSDCCEEDSLPIECCCSDDGMRMLNSDMASLMATSDSVTAVVADDLNSTQSPPCEWFVCDDDQSGTRFFVIQGSETLASWQANLMFEPVQFEGLDVIVHRGIYEAAKGMYEKMLPEIRAHLKTLGDRATFRFTGHSLGGSLALLINLMLLIRNEAPASSLLPVITFGAPSIMCGGDHLLRKLGLPRSHVKAITMHRDIVPRAFSCHYPNHVAEFLKAVNGNFRNHPCLSSQNLLYAPMGDLVILQPDEKFSPSHHLLPAGSGLYVLTAAAPENRLRAAKAVFLNSPHPLEILRDRSSYGPDGAVQRDHDMNSYLKCVREFIRQELARARKARREHRRNAWWPIAGPQGVRAGVVMGPRPISVVVGQARSSFSGIVRTGRDSVSRFGRLVASQHMHLFVVLLFPARMLLLGAYNVISIY